MLKYLFFQTPNSSLFLFFIPKILTQYIPSISYSYEKYILPHILSIYLFLKFFLIKTSWHKHCQLFFIPNLYKLLGKDLIRICSHNHKPIKIYQGTITSYGLKKNHYKLKPLQVMVWKENHYKLKPLQNYGLEWRLLQTENHYQVWFEI